MIDSTDELMKSYEVIRSIVERHSQYDAAQILTLNLATCITTGIQQDQSTALARYDKAPSTQTTGQALGSYPACKLSVRKRTLTNAREHDIM